MDNKTIDDAFNIVYSFYKKHPEQNGKYEFIPELLMGFPPEVAPFVESMVRLNNEVSEIIVNALIKAHPESTGKKELIKKSINNKLCLRRSVYYYITDYWLALQSRINKRRLYNDINRPN